ncbi:MULTISPECIES: acyltransferase family protein [unclassified Leifsonia]|uniref:acyltransferase family protein n=1 Tax=unclassified Leifsonia TaxID=2663824 RepID=UPI000A775C84|nr:MULTISPECIES: acyltransferase [unclassified Leifsonia]
MTVRVAERSTMTLDARFDPRANGLNAVRLLLASGVIVWHAFPLTGQDIPDGPLRQLLAFIWVDGFFAASGFLIVSSWMRRPNWWAFLSARLLRILPAFYTCLIITAFAIAPLAIWLSGSVFPPGFWADAVGYVLKNSSLRIFQYDIAGTPLGVPDSGVWNGSIWTLWWEFLCYLGVLLLGVTGLIKRSWALPAAFVLCVIGVLATSYGPIDNFYVYAAARFGIMFLAGGLVYHFRHRIRASWTLVIVAMAIVIASAWLPDYRVVAAIPLAYAVITTGALLRQRIFWLRNDISYGIYVYAFPIQQTLVLLGAAAWGIPGFVVLSIALTIPFAVASWVFVERPALRLRKRAQGVST